MKRIGDDSIWKIMSKSKRGGIFYLILSDNQDSELKQTLKQLLKHATEPVQMCIESNGEVYLID